MFKYFIVFILLYPILYALEEKNILFLSSCHPSISSKDINDTIKEEQNYKINIYEHYFDTLRLRENFYENIEYNYIKDTPIIYLDKKLLPNEIEIINVKKMFWQKYPLEIIIALILFLMFLIMIIVLKYFNLKLQYLNEEIKKKTKENIRQSKLLRQQNKLASMGEMIGAIAHQWRQPLNELSIKIQKLNYKFEDNEIDKKYIETFIEENIEIIDFMSKTIDDFRNFFKIDKQKVKFDVKKTINETLSLFSGQLKNHNILVTLNGESFFIDGFISEFKQVISNIINNAKDVLIEKKIKTPKIDITIENNSIIIKDNGKGIKEEVIDKIFEPYFTTKEEEKGSGIGLYISKMIIENNMKGKISVQSDKNGTIFTIKF